MQVFITEEETVAQEKFEYTWNHRSPDGTTIFYKTYLSIPVCWYGAS
jgi:hypothetical protein